MTSVSRGAGLQRRVSGD